LTANDITLKIKVQVDHSSLDLCHHTISCADSLAPTKFQSLNKLLNYLGWAG